MRKLLKRWYVWLGLVLLLGLAGSALIYSSRSRITQANFDRIVKRMKLSEVEQLLGKCDCREPIHVIWREGQEDTTRTVLRESCCWTDGPNMISVDINQDGKVLEKKITLVTAWEWLKWYAKRGAAKIGINMD
jgi:hypothetical protein